MSQRNVREFFSLYQRYRYEDQINFYVSRVKEFEQARTQAIWISIILMGLTVLTGSIGSTNSIPVWLKLSCQLAAAIFPILSTAIAAYSSLYGFEQQAKLYQDSIDNLVDASDDLEPTVLAGLDENQFTLRVNKYVKDVERVFHDEQGQWGQLAKKFKPQE
ncbi:MAG: hypothetical protein NVSMB49_05150 [Ktedonobacteraceae bacterium]